MPIDGDGTSLAAASIAPAAKLNNFTQHVWQDLICSGPQPARRAHIWPPDPIEDDGLLTAPAIKTLAHMHSDVMLLLNNYGGGVVACLCIWLAEGQRNST